MKHVSRRETLMSWNIIRRTGVAAAVAALNAPGAAFAQSCAMCYTSAAAAKEGGVAALRHGILILLFPPLLIFLGICVAAFRSRDRFASGQTGDSAGKSGAAHSSTVNRVPVRASSVLP